MAQRSRNPLTLHLILHLRPLLLTHWGPNSSSQGLPLHEWPPHLNWGPIPGCPSMGTSFLPAWTLTSHTRSLSVWISFSLSWTLTACSSHCCYPAPASPPHDFRIKFLRKERERDMKRKSRVKRKRKKGVALKFLRY